MSGRAALAGAVLVLLSLFTVRVRGQAVAEGYALARCRVLAESIERRAHDAEARFALLYDEIARQEAVHP